MSEKVVLAYSGGLDTSVAIAWLKEKYGYDVVAMCVDVGEGENLEAVQQKALQVGAVKSYRIDGVKLFAEQFILPALKAGALYEGKYPLASALSRPLISQLLVDVAAKEGAVAVAHGCTGKGNDQVRFEVSIQALNPQLKVIAPVREWGFTRDEEIQFAAERNIPLPITKENPFSIDANLWGRAIECGVLEDPWAEAPEDAFAWTIHPVNAPEHPVELTIGFVAGCPVSLNGEEMPLATLISKLNQIAGQAGVGRIDCVENRLVGIKSREVYEAPAAVTLIQAHKELEALTLPREVAEYKAQVELQYHKLIYNGLWFSPLKSALDAFVTETQRYVTGEVRVVLYKGHLQVTGRKSPYSLYSHQLATYSEGDMFHHQDAVGFIQLWGMPTKVQASIQGSQVPGVSADDIIEHIQVASDESASPTFTGEVEGETVQL
ncbi:argininosuccinate synthase [Alicyclobacillus tolerans]|uniref:Argininosuccinate synthase n=1 Tax=Alicyclobacillus tolerans TaxID=90970 RepID=A0ABT9LVL5_9BACL|nr:argininosuccinate synthase [Alicyclobacillus tengchongensis]MDP9728319.1 argininosuccinate synthase [Alicyclobacillus tengchongensis]